MSNTPTYVTDIHPGDRFGNLTVLEYLGEKTKPSGFVSDIWLVRCDCGGKFKVQGESLLSGYVTMCKFCTGEWPR